MNELLHIKVSNALPGMPRQTGPPLAQGTLRITVISKELECIGNGLRDLSQQSSEVTDSSPDESGFGMTANTRGRLLLNLRDGPPTPDSYRGRDPIREPKKERYIPAQTQNLFVRLCVFSVPSVVKKNTTEQQISTAQHRVIILLNTKESSQALHGNDPFAGGAFLNSVMGLEICKKVISCQ